MKSDDLRAAAVAAVEQGNLGAARPLWSLLCEREPLDLDNWLILAAIDERLGFFPAALSHLGYALYLDSNEADVWLKSAQIKWKMRDFNGALNDLATALSLDFTDIDVRILFASWLIRLHKFELAFRQYQYLLKSSQVTDDLLFNVLACAYVCKQALELDAWCTDERVALDTERVHYWATKVAACVLTWLPPHRWPQWSNKQGGIGIGCKRLFQIVSEVLEQKRNDYDWQSHNTYIAHTEDVIVSHSEQLAVAGLAALVNRCVATEDGSTSHVFEFGCGTGQLGQQIKANNASILLTGVDYSDVALKVANGKNNYDTLVHKNVLSNIDADLLRGLDCIVISHRVSQYQSQISLLAKLLKVINPQAVVIVMFGATGISRVDQEAVVARLPDEVNQFDWHALLDSDNENCALLIRARVLENNLEPVKSVDSLEQGGNALISATMSLTQGRFDECRRDCHTALKIKPRTSQALFSLGLIAQHAGEHAKAISYYRQARIKYRGFADNWFQIATVHQHHGNLRAMFNAYRQCLSFAPAHIAALQNLVGLYFSQGNMDAVWHHLRLLLLHYALDELIIERVEGTIKQSKDDVLQKYYQEFMEGMDWLMARFNAAMQSKYFERAEKYLDEIEVYKKDEGSRFLRAQLEEKRGRLTLAKKHLLILHEQNEKNEMYLHGMASISAAQGLIYQSFQTWMAALEVTEIENTNWQNFLFFSNYCDFVSDQTVSEYHFKWGRALSEKQSAKRVNEEKCLAVTQSSPDKIRIGYVSADFRMHSVSMFLYNILKHHDAERFSIYCYSMTPAEDSMTVKLRYFSDYWRNINFMSDDDLVARIQLDKIDILVDLAGHTSGNRLPVFALCPAPIQCAYLGYPNTTGLTEVDYRFTDSEADPEGMTEHFHSEQLIRLPNGFLSYSRHLASTPVTLYEQRDDARHYTFACCNNIFKVNEHVVSVFSQILKQMPEASLLLKAHNLNNPEVLEHYQRLFESQGVAEHQVHLMNTIDVAEHQNLYNSIDIALDPFPYNGTTTTCDALWMGVPVLVLAGTRHAGRVGVSIMTRIGMTDWIAQTEQEYISKAIEHARDKENLARVKLGMRQRLLSSPLMQPRRVVKDIEHAYLDMIQAHSAS